MKIFAMKSVSARAFYLIPASDATEAEEAMQKWKPGEYAYVGESIDLPTGEPVPIAMLEVGFRVCCLTEQLGIQSSQLKL